MNRLLKTLLLWLLMAALPVQGFAAAMKASCRGTHHGSLAAVAMQADDHRQAAMHSHHDEAASHGHHHAGAEHADTGHTAPDSSAANAKMSDTQGKHLNSFCSACAACCIGAAAPPAASIPTLHSHSAESFVIYSTAMLPSHITAGLERPPRLLS